MKYKLFRGIMPALFLASMIAGSCRAPREAESRSWENRLSAASAAEREVITITDTLLLPPLEAGRSALEPREVRIRTITKWKVRTDTLRVTDTVMAVRSQKVSTKSTQEKRTSVHNLFKWLFYAFVFLIFLKCLSVSRKNSL